MAEGTTYVADFEEGRAWGPFGGGADADAWVADRWGGDTVLVSIVDVADGPVDAETWLAGMDVRDPQADW